MFSTSLTAGEVNLSTGAGQFTKTGIAPADPAVFQADAFQTEPIRVDWERRQASLYANWDEDRKVWSEPATPDARVVRTSAARLVDFIDHAIGNGLR